MKKMKTTILTLVIISFLSFNLSQANNTGEETKKGAKQHITYEKVDLNENYFDIDFYNYSIEDEADVDDILFDTKQVVENYHSYNLLKIDEIEFFLEEEEDIDDIPFNTAIIVKEYK